MVGRGLVPRQIVRKDKPPAYPDNYVRTPFNIAKNHKSRPLTTDNRQPKHIIDNK